MVVTSDAVTNTIIKLHKVFGDDSRHPSYIETISKSGYRLIAEVDLRPVETPEQESSRGSKGGRLAQWLVPLLIALLLSLWLFFPGQRNR